MKKNLVHMNSNERKIDFTKFINNKSADKQVRELEKAFLEINQKNYKTVFDITDYHIIEKYEDELKKTKPFYRKTVGGTDAQAGLNHYKSYLRNKKDSYFSFLEYFNIKDKDIIDWGIKSAIYPEIDEVDREWDLLKNKILYGKNETVYIRGYGRNAKNTPILINLYKDIFSNCNIEIDSTNNSRPQKLMEKMTKLNRKKDIYNYQTSHIFGKTKNPFLFMAPWNMCFVPKLIDPLTGHEASAELPEKFKVKWYNTIYKKYEKYIKEYNDIIKSMNLEKKIKEYCSSLDDISEKNKKLLEKNIIEQLSIIEISNTIDI